ncbi:hypothetical protein B0H10DRAFT_2231652 [Mycena sp. CBHHK59/15]|nr:hypothetical protein B0H10DRAFT_2231652 [Mycena sp. CBHHK59/15]
MDSKTAFHEPAAEPGLAYYAVAETDRPRTCNKRKFLKAIGFGALTLWALSQLARLHSRPVFFERAQMSLQPWPVPSNVVIDHCAEWSDGVTSGSEFPYSSDVGFELPVSSETLFLISREAMRRGSIFSTGRVNYVQSDDASESVTVDITAFYWTEEHLNAAKACLLKRDGNENGVGIFVRISSPQTSAEVIYPISDQVGSGYPREKHDKLRFEVTVTFPRASDDLPLAINNLSTDLGIFSQTFGDMSDIVFKSLSLKAALAPIYAESLYAGNATLKTSLGSIKVQSLLAENADIQTSMGPIEGTFNASNTLSLVTHNAHIIVDVNLVNAQDEKPAKLHMSTSNSLLQSKITLEASKKIDPAFDITARTSNAGLDLAVLAAPIDSTVTLHATTSIGRAAVVLPPTYEGSFRAATSLSPISVKVDEKAADPKGEGRTRSVEYVQLRHGMAHGTVAWSPEGKTRGAVTVRTSLSPLSLEF